ncbi:MAG TPA: GntR family transcriptional regulator [Terriglobales bacterium]|nr:GntR family transcriptional regulator [Terriglobales bacterium]
MKILVSKTGAVSVREQIIEQVRVAIGAGELEPGDALPSVRELAKQLGIHHNTVSHAYRHLAQRGWVVMKPGAGVFVNLPDEHTALEQARDLDELINAFLAFARERGYKLQEIRERVRARMAEQPPDHYLVVEEDRALAQIIAHDLAEATGSPASACTPQELQATPGLALGAVLAVPVHALQKFPDVYPRRSAPVPVEFPRAKEFVERVRALDEPSVIAIASESMEFIEAARGLAASAAGRKHEIVECLLGPKDAPPEAADLVICDSRTRARVKARNVMVVTTLSKKSLAALRDALPGKA